MQIPDEDKEDSDNEEEDGEIWGCIDGGVGGK
jgi:hypothetical protein